MLVFVTLLPAALPRCAPKPCAGPFANVPAGFAVPNVLPLFASAPKGFEAEDEDEDEDDDEVAAVSFFFLCSGTTLAAPELPLLLVVAVVASVFAFFLMAAPSKTK